MAALLLLLEPPPQTVPFGPGWGETGVAHSLTPAWKGSRPAAALRSAGLLPSAVCRYRYTAASTRGETVRHTAPVLVCDDEPAHSLLEERLTFSQVPSRVRQQFGLECLADRRANLSCQALLLLIWWQPPRGVLRAVLPLLPSAFTLLFSPPLRPWFRKWSRWRWWQGSRRVLARPNNSSSPMTTRRPSSPPGPPSPLVSSAAATSHRRQLCLKGRHSEVCLLQSSWGRPPLSCRGPRQSAVPIMIRCLTKAPTSPGPTRSSSRGGSRRTWHDTQGWQDEGQI